MYESSTTAKQWTDFDVVVKKINYNHIVMDIEWIIKKTNWVRFEREPFEPNQNRARSL